MVFASQCFISLLLISRASTVFRLTVITKMQVNLLYTVMYMIVRKDGKWIPSEIGRESLGLINYRPYVAENHDEKIYLQIY
jgi:hypothetical protein